MWKSSLGFAVLTVAALLLSSGICRAQPAAIHDVREFGAVGDGTTLNTKAFQAAIDKSGAAGGGTVLVKEGRYVTGTLYFKSDVTLRVEAGAVLLGSPNIADCVRGCRGRENRGFS